MFSNQYSYAERDKTQWNGAPVHTSQMTFELSTLVNAYRGLAPQRVVEIGSEHGGTLHYWLTEATPGATVVSIDLYTPEVVPVHPEKRWRSWCPEDVELHCLWGNSQTEAMRDQLTDIVPEIDFLFIDGDHTYPGVKRDFELYGPLVRKGGLIAFHDLITPEFSPHIGVGQLWREIQRGGYITQELYALPPDKQQWGGIGVVHR